MKTRTRLNAFTTILVFLCAASLGVAAMANSKRTPPPAKVDVITLYGDVDEASANQVIAQIQQANAGDSKEEIRFYLDTPGGFVMQGDRIVNAMLSSKRPIHTINAGLAASMGAWIFSYGQTRSMLPRSTLMFHESHGMSGGTQSQQMSAVQYNERIMTLYNQRVAEISGLTLEQIRNQELREWWLIGNEAVAVGIANDVITDLKVPPHPPKKEKDKPQE